jgi:cyanophycinase
MKKRLILFICLILTVSLPATSETKGYLFIIGGGRRPESMMKKFIELSEKFNSGKIVVFPMASSVPQEVGQEQAEQLRKYGAKEVEYHILSREQALEEENTQILEDVGGVFFSGGVQSRLTAVLINTPVHKKLLEMYEKGCTIGGTSAGAAVMSEIMITGDEKREVERGHEFETIQASNIVTLPGFGFIKTAIIDQHFIRRKRHNRLISLVAENPKLLGIGIDESTAVVVCPDETFEVIGEQSVIVYDFSRAQIRLHPTQSISGANMRMHILNAGDRFNLKKKRVIK